MTKYFFLVNELFESFKQKTVTEKPPISHSKTSSLEHLRTGSSDQLLNSGKAGSKTGSSEQLLSSRKTGSSDQLLNNGKTGSTEQLLSKTGSSDQLSSGGAKQETDIQDDFAKMSIHNFKVIIN